MTENKSHVSALSLKTFLFEDTIFEGKTLIIDFEEDVFRALKKIYPECFQANIPWNITPTQIKSNNLRNEAAKQLKPFQNSENFQSILVKSIENLLFYPKYTNQDSEFKMINTYLEQTFLKNIRYFHEYYQPYSNSHSILVNSLIRPHTNFNLTVLEFICNFSAIKNLIDFHLELGGFIHFLKLKEKGYDIPECGTPNLLQWQIHIQFLYSIYRCLTSTDISKNIFDILSETYCDTFIKNATIFMAPEIQAYFEDHRYMFTTTLYHFLATHFKSNVIKLNRHIAKNQFESIRNKEHCSQSRIYLFSR